MDLLKGIEGAQEELIQTLRALIAIPSIKGEPGAQGEPFGREIARALDYVLTWGRENGFETKTYRVTLAILNTDKGRQPSVYLCIWMWYQPGRKDGITRLLPG